MIARGMLLSMLWFSGSLFANDHYLAIAQEALAKKAALIAPYQQDAKYAMTKAEQAIDRLMQDTRKFAAKDQPALSAVLIFVSFSMPKESLLAYLRDAKRANATIVIRGLAQNSFQKTMLRIQGLVQESDGQGVALDPLLFRQFRVQAVPTIMALAPNSGCLRKQNCDRTRDADTVTGHVTLAAALKIIRDRGTVAPRTAALALAKLQGAHHA